jgi:hypothetical protein
MEYQFTHQDEKRDGKQSERGNGRKDPCHYRNKAWYPSKEEIGRNHIDNEKGKGNGQVGEKQEDHTSKEQANDQPPFHGLPPCPNIDKLGPRHSEKLDGKENAAYGDDDENGPFWDSHCPDISYPFDDTFAHMVNPKIDHDGTGKAADDKHDIIEIAFCLFIEMSVDDIGSDMPFLSQKPGCCKENDPQQGILSCLHDPYRRLRK